MYLYKKNIILVPADFDGTSMAKGILSLDCYADKTICSLRTYNLHFAGNLTLGVAVNKKLNKINVNGSLNSQKFELPVSLSNADHVSIVLLNINNQNYDIVLWGSTELNASWRSTLQFMLEDEFKTQNEQPNYTQNISHDTFDYNNEKQIKNNKLKDFEEYSSFEIENFKTNCLQSQTINEETSKTNQTSEFDLNSLLQANKKEDLLNENDLNNHEYLKNNNIEEFLDSVISLEQEQDMAEFEENSSHLEEVKTKEDTFYDRISYQIEKMFVANEQEKCLMK